MRFALIQAYCCTFLIGCGILLHQFCISGALLRRIASALKCCFRAVDAFKRLLFSRIFRADFPAPHGIKKAGRSPCGKVLNNYRKAQRGKCDSCRGIVPCTQHRRKRPALRRRCPFFAESKHSFPCECNSANTHARPLLCSDKTIFQFLILYLTS